jgi:hypothetical protein
MAQFGVAVARAYQWIDRRTGGYGRAAVVAVVAVLAYYVFTFVWALLAWMWGLVWGGAIGGEDELMWGDGVLSTHDTSTRTPPNDSNWGDEDSEWD